MVKYNWRDPRVGIRKGVMPVESISHTWLSSRKYFDGGEYWGSQGSRVMGRNHEIPTIATPRTH